MGTRTYQEVDAEGRDRRKPLTTPTRCQEDAANPPALALSAWRRLLPLLQVLRHAVDTGEAR